MFKNELYSQPSEENTVIAHVNDKAIMIMKDYPKKLFYEQIDYCYITIGEHLVEAQPKPLELLTYEEQSDIISAVIQLEGGLT